MKSYWIWLLMNLLIWPLALLYPNQPIVSMIGNLFGTALYFIIFFILPLFERKPKILLTFLSINGIIVILIFHSASDTGFNAYLLLLLTLNIAEGFYRLHMRYSLIHWCIVTVCLGTISISSQLNIYIQCFIIVYMLTLLIGLAFYKRTKDRNSDLEVRYDVLLSEYRDVKRRKVSQDEITRQEERMLIAHEIHDSVGHKLVALLMQLEAFRLGVPEKEKEHVEFLKQLASESLEETRKAVKSMKTNETGGVAGILRLIRKLEVESFMRIHFTVKHGAFTAPLTGEQSFVIYRSVQEALTNIMKHSHSREAEIIFEAPGGRIFRFEITNKFHSDTEYKEGFGLSSMRDRLEKYGGELEVYQTEEQFIVRGTLEIGYGGETNDSNITSGRPSHGQTRLENDD